MCWYKCLLLCTTKDNVKSFDLDKKILVCKVLDVYDGDTFTAAIPFAGSIYSVRVRMSGIDAPEIKTKDEDEKRRRVVLDDL